MDYAFDIIFQEKEDAKEVAKTAKYLFGKRYRYKCLCCGEEVNLVAADSVKRTPHFKHYAGNNDTECELYLGRPGVLAKCVSKRKNEKEHIGFCFNIDNKTFEISVTFSEEEIENNEAKEGTLSVYNKYCSEDFFSVPINRGNLVSDVGNYFILCEYSNDYYVSIDSGKTKTLYPDVIKRDCKLNIYRVNQQSVHYKRNTSDTLYTNYWYYAVSENGDSVEELINLQGVMTEQPVVSFITQGKQLYGVKFSIGFIDESLRRYFYSQELEVDYSESMDILWPPVFKKDTEYISESERVFMASSFELVPHGNIEARGIDIQKLCDDVYEVLFNDKVTICEKNVERQIVKVDRTKDNVTFEDPQIIYADKYIISDEYDYYLFDKNGCTKLIVGTQIYLSGTDRIVGYKNNHIIVIIRPVKEVQIDKKRLINEIIMYHPQTEIFEPDEFMDVEADEIVLSYIESCYRSGRINTVVKRYIKEKLI